MSGRRSKKTRHKNHGDVALRNVPFFVSGKGLAAKKVSSFALFV